MAEVVQDEISISIKSSADDAAKSVKTLSSELKGLDAALKGLSIAGLLNGFKKMGSSIFSFTEKMSNYIQTMNQFRIVMGSSTKEAQKFVNSAQDILGLDPQQMQSSLATFKSLGESFGISSNNAYIMSKNLTQLAADMSTFKGISFEQSLQKIKSGFVGEIEPMRAVGVALDKATLQETAYRLGIEQRIDTMTRAQKTELLYYQMMTATTQMQGSMAKNLMTPATAIRQIQMEFAQLGRAIGSIFIPMLMKTLPYIRAITELATEAAQALADMFGFKMKDFQVSANDVAVSLGDVGAGIEDIGSGAGKAAKELRKMLMPFDELNNVNFESTASGSGIGSALGVGGSLGIPLEQYDMFANASDEMRKNIDKIKESLKGLVPVIKNVALVMGALWIGKKILDFIIYLGKVKDAFSTLKSFIMGGKLGPLITSLGTGLKNLFWNTNLGQSIKNFKAGTGGISKVFLNIASAVGGTVLSIKGFTDMSKVMDDAWKTGTVDGMKYAGALAEISGGFALVGYSIGGLAGAGIGALIGLVTGLVQSIASAPPKFNEFRKSAEELNKVVNEQKEAVDKDKESWDNLANSTKENVEKQLAQAGRIQSLVDELDDLADSTGKVQDGDKARVDFILNELNNAYGTEYKLSGNQITQNGEEVKSLDALKDAIQKVIDKKKAEAIIDATQDKYAEALQKKSKYYDEYQKALKNQTTAAEKLRETFKRYGVTLDDINEKTVEQAVNALGGRDALNAMEDGLGELLEAYQNSTDSVTKSSKMWEEASNTIIDVEALRTAVLQDDYEAIEKSLDNLTNTIEVDGKRQTISIEQRLKEQTDIYKLSYEKMTDEQKKAFDRQLSQTAQALAEQTNLVETLTPETLEAWKKLAETSKDTYNEAISKVSEGTRLAIETANGQIDISSPTAIERWRNLASSSETEYKRALGLLPEDTRQTIQNAIGTMEGQKREVNQKAGEVGSGAAGTANTSFDSNLNLQINGSDISLGNKNGFATLGSTITSWIKSGMNVLSIGASIAGKLNVGQYASGGFPQTGQLFMANEAGPELVGNIGRRTAVANQGQITEGIATATYNAISRALAENRGNNGTNPQVNVYLGNERLYSGYSNYQDEQSNMYGVAL